MIKKICILDIPSPGILGGVFSDLICALSTSFKKFGIEVEYSRNKIDPKIPTIIFGFYRLFIDNQKLPPIPPNIIIFNLSPLPFSKEKWFGNYIGAISKYNLIDYSFENLNFLGKLNNQNVKRHRFEFGYTELSVFTFPKKNQSYLFYGKINQLRTEKINYIKNLGIKINVLTNTWGLERDIQICTSKAIVNLPKYEKNILEVYRLWHALCLGTPVFSEKSLDPNLNNEFSRFIQFFDDISMLQNPDENIKSPEIYKRETCLNSSIEKLLQYIEDINA